MIVGALLLGLLGGAPPTDLVPLRIRSRPSGARVVVTLGDGRTRRGRTPLRWKLPRGPVELEISRRGYQTERRSLQLDGATEHHACLDRPGQLLDCLRVMRVGSRPKALAFRPGSHELWVTLYGGPPSLRAFDPESGARLASLRLGQHGAIELVFTPDGSRLYASQLESHAVFEIDVAQRSTLRRLKVGSRWPKVVALSADGTRLFTSNWKGHDVSEIDLASGQLLRRLPTTRTPRGLYPTADGRRLYVAGFGRGELDRIELASGARTTVFQGGRVLRHLVGDAERGRLYISDMKQRKIFVLDLASEQVRELARTDANPNTLALSPDRALLFVSNRGVNGPDWLDPGPTWGTVLVLDAHSGERLDAVVAGNQTTGLAVSDDGSLLALSDLHDDTVRVYRVPTTAALRAGNGGYAKRARRALRKKDPPQ